MLFGVMRPTQQNACFASHQLAPHGAHEHLIAYGVLISGEGALQCWLRTTGFIEGQGFVGHVGAGMGQRQRLIEVHMELECPDRFHPPRFGPTDEYLRDGPYDGESAKVVRISHRRQKIEQGHRGTRTSGESLERRSMAEETGDADWIAEHRLELFGNRKRCIVVAQTPKEHRHQLAAESQNVGLLSGQGQGGAQHGFGLFECAQFIQCLTQHQPGGRRWHRGKRGPSQSRRHRKIVGIAG